MLAISRALIAATALAVAAQWSFAQARETVPPADAKAVGAAVPVEVAVGVQAPGPASPLTGPGPAAPSPAATTAPGSAVPAAMPASVDASARSIPADTEVLLETAQPLSSATAKRGDAFALRLAEPLLVNGATVLPAGATCHGEIIHAERSRGGGKPGELLLAARYIEHEGRRIPLRGFRLSGAGKEKTGAALGTAMVVGPLAMFVRGGQIEIPVGSRAQARIVQAVDLSAPVAPAAPVASAAATPAIAAADPGATRLPAAPASPAAANAATASGAAPSSVSTHHPTTGEVVQ